MTRCRPTSALWTIVLVAAACGSNGSVATPDTPAADVAPDATGATTTAPTTTAPTTTAATSATTAARVVPPNGHAVIDDRGAEVHVASTARVIPLDGDVAEIVYALGLGDRVVATDLSATYPPAADALPQIGYQRALVAEPILAFEPTLLIATDLAGPPETLDDLERVGVPLVVVPDEATPTGAAEKILAVAEALGVPDRGRTLAERVQGEIAAAIDTVADAPTGLRVATLYVRGSGTQLVLGEAYASHWLIEAAGAIDVADELGVVESAPITDEAMLVAAPDVLLVPASGLESVGGVTGLLDALPALARTPAGVAGAVLSYDDQLMLGNGPRAGSFLATLIADLRDRAPTES